MYNYVQKVVLNYLEQTHEDSVTVTILPDPDNLKFVNGKYQTVELGKDIVFEILEEGDTEISALVDQTPFEEIFSGNFESGKTYNSRGKHPCLLLPQYLNFHGAS